MGRVGVEWQRFSISTSSEDVTLPAGDEVPLTERYTRAAFTPGVGIELDLFDKASLGLEYRTALYSRKTEIRPSSESDVASTVFRHKPRVDSVLIRLNYKLIQFPR